MATLAVGPLLPGVPVVLAMTGEALGGQFVAESPIQMAGLAGYLCVTPTQGIARIAIVIEGRRLPFVLQVAGLAASTQTAAVDIFFCMTSIAILRQIVHVQLARMARFALHRSVRLAQFEIGIAIVVEANRFPRHFVMARPAFIAESTLVNVLLLMARGAHQRGLVIESLIPVAGEATDLAMRAEQGKLRAGMVEQRVFPAAVIVALAAVVSQTATVGVVLAMTRDAIARSVLEDLISMARAAFRWHVPASQRKTRFLMVELDFLPTRLHVALGAVGAEFFAMNVILPVARVTGVRGIAEFLRSRMAVRALRVRVLASQKEVAERVIEALLVKVDYSCGPALMIRVAFAARLVRESAVVARLRANILRHVLVTGQAQCVLRFFLERLMTLAALSFDVRVPLDHLSGHDQRFHRVRKDRHRTQHDGDQ